MNKKIIIFMILLSIYFLLNGVKEEPDDLIYHYQIGKISALSGKFTIEGINSLELYISQENDNANPSKSAACWRLGLIYEKINDPDKAKESYERGFQLGPEDGYCHEALGQLKN